MRPTASRPLFSLAASLPLLLVACGGGSSVAPGEGTPVAPAATFDIGGVSAKGAAFGGATVTVSDQTTKDVFCAVTDEVTGAYSCKLSGLTPPLLIKASRGDDNLFSLVAPTSTASATANITPLTNAVVAGLSSDGDPKKVQISSITATSVNTQVSTLQTSLASVIAATESTNVDLFTGSLTAGSGQAMDKLLDAVKVSTSSGKIEIALAADLSKKVTLTGTSATGSISTSDVAAVQTFIDSKPATLIDNFVKSLNACYALPTAQRVSNASGGAADVIGTCKGLFKGGDAANFKSGGNSVGYKSAYKSLFAEGGTHLKFDRPSLEFVVKNPGAPNDGYWVVSYRSTDSAGNVDYASWALSLEGDSSKQLRLAGNQYDHDTGVSTFVQDREFVNEPASSYLSTGYSLKITNKISGGSSVYKQVVVTAPDGTTFTLKPLAGCSYLGLNNGTKTSCTNFVRMSAGYKDPSKTGAMPTLDQTNLYFASTPWTDEQIAAIPDQGEWTFVLTLAGSSGTTVTQKHRTQRRAPTLAELRALSFVGMTTATRTELLQETKDQGYIVLGDGVIDVSAEGNRAAWEVPSTALAPTQVTVYGNAPRTSNGWGSGFNDSTTVLSSARQAVIQCSRQTDADAHCKVDVAVGGSGMYAAGSRVTELQLNANSPRGMTLSKHIAMYFPNPAP